MKNLFLIFCLLAAFVACSDDKEEMIDYDPFSPVTGIAIPTKENMNAEIAIQGRGFAADCEIWLQLNGGDKVQADIVKVDDKGVAFTVRDIKPGFYIVILKQDDKEYRIGGINLFSQELNETDIEAYAVRGEFAPAVYPISISRKTVGKSLFAMRPGYYLGTLAPAADDKIYYSGFASVYDPEAHSIKMEYYIEYYDIKTGKQQILPYANVNDYFAMGLIAGELHLLHTADQKIYTLSKLAADGSETIVQTFDFSVFGKQKLWNETGGFLYAPQQGVLIVCTYTGGEDRTYNTYALEMATGVIRENGKNSLERFATAIVDNRVYYFCRQYTESNESYTTRILCPADPSDWTLNDPSALIATLKGTDLNLPIYCPEKKLIYGIGEDETVLTFDLVNPAVTPQKWVKSGCSYLFIMDSDNN